MKNGRSTRGLWVATVLLLLPLYVLLRVFGRRYMERHQWLTLVVAVLVLATFVAVELREHLSARRPDPFREFLGARLRIYSRRAWLGNVGIYKVLIDGRLVARIRTGETLEIGVEPGKHVVVIDAGWGTRSDDVAIDATPMRDVELEYHVNVWAAVRNNTPWLYLLLGDEGGSPIELEPRRERDIRPGR
jgi:hypothetical protein